MHTRQVILLLWMIINVGQLVAQAPNPTLNSPATSLRGPLKLTSTTNRMVNLDESEITDPKSLLLFKETDINGSPIEFTASILDESIITITPNDLLKPNQTYFLRLAPVRGKNGGKEEIEAQTYTFTTGKAAEVSTVGAASNICIGDPDGAEISNIVVS